MSKQCYFLISILFFMVSGCTKDYNLYENGSKKLYVIEGKVSNLRGPYYVRVTKSGDLSGDDTGGLDNAEAVKGALVTISDDMGTTDTLVPADWRVSRVSSYTGERGYYQTTKITGSPGHTYHLQVRTGNETFEASAYMPYVTTLDSIELRNSIPVADTNFHPSQTAYAYFKEPQSEENYYLLQLYMAFDSTYDVAHVYLYEASNIFPFYVFDDKTLPPYVNGMAVGAILANVVDNGGFMPYPVVPYDNVTVRLCSLTREAYEYFVAVEKQFVADGNVYKPAPASATGNISGGALGLFWATHISYKVRW